MTFGRYNTTKVGDMQRAWIDAQREAARRESIKRSATKRVDGGAPEFRGAALELQTVLGRHFEVIVKGPAECVAGETLILDPCTGVEAPISSLAALGAPITVLTQFGPQTIGAPFRKGYSALYRVTCDNGDSFVATAKHRVLTDQGWCFVGDLCEGRTYLQTLAVSSLEPYPLRYRQGDQRWYDTREGYRNDCLTYRRQCDAPPHQALDTALTSVPLLSDAPVRTHDCYSRGDQEPLQVYNHLCQSSSRHASDHYDRPCCHTACKEYLHLEANASHAAYSYAYDGPSQRGIALAPQAEIARLDVSGCLDYDDLSYRCSPISNGPFEQYAASYSRVSSITFDRYDAYYDMHVPGAEHYYAQGFWHHNTGKTFACCYLLDSILQSNPGVQAVMARKVRDTLLPTVLQTYIKIIAGRLDVIAYGGKHPLWYDYANGSRLWLAGLDDPGKALSSERDIVYVNQCEDLSVGDWETLTTRVTGRAGNLHTSLMLGDCNPTSPNHWTVKRSSLQVLRSYHKDNPTLFNELGEITSQGTKTLGILSNLTEPRRSRLFLGIDSSAEGQVYSMFDRTVHVVKRFAIPKAWPCIRVIDFGFNDPFVCKWYAYDRAGDRLICYREIYMTQRLVEDHAKQIASLEGWELDSEKYKRYEYNDRYLAHCISWKRPMNERENIIATICDHDAEDRATLARYGLPNIPAFKPIKIGIDAVTARLRSHIDLGVRLVYFEDQLVEVDSNLANLYMPTSTLDEFDGYVWAPTKDGRPSKELPIDLNNHGMDTDRYAVCFIDSIGSELEDGSETLVYDADYEISPV